MKFKLFIPDASPKIININEKSLWNMSVEGMLQNILDTKCFIDTVDQYGHPFRVRASAVTHYAPLYNEETHGPREGS